MKGRLICVPIRVERYVAGRADRYHPLSGERDCAGVCRVELESLAGREKRGKRNDCLMQLAGVVGVGINGGYLKGNVLCAETNVLPIECGGDLQGDAGKRGFAVVANGEQYADCDLLVCRSEVNVKIKSCEGDGLALGILRWGQLACDGGRRCSGAGLRGGFAVFVGGAGEDDLAFGRMSFRGPVTAKGWFALRKGWSPNK